MTRYNVEVDEKWACFSTVSDRFITPFMTIEEFEKWRIDQYGFCREPLENTNRMSLAEALRDMSIYLSDEDFMENLRFTELIEGNNIEKRICGLQSVPTVTDQPCDMENAPADMVNHPAHYTQGGIECIDAIKAAVTGLTGMEAVCTGNIIRYIWRWKFKNGLEDLKKCRWYIDKLIEEVEGAKG